MTRFIGKTKAGFTGTTAYGKQKRTTTAGVFAFGFGYQQKQSYRRVVYHTLKVVLSAISANGNQKSCRNFRKSNILFRGENNSFEQPLYRIGV